jgi:capsule polysaccharide export protein KpsE/RkpR
MAPKGILKTNHSVEETFEFAVPALPAEGVNNERLMIVRARLLWDHRAFLSRVAAVSLLLMTVVAFLIPNQYTSTVSLMPPDQESGAGMGMLAALAGKAGGSFGSLGAELLGLKTNGDLFVGILGSRTVQNEIVSEFDLRRVYGTKRWETARKRLADRTTISQDRKSGILTVVVSDRSAERAQQIAREYVAQLNQVVNVLNTSAAHRERVFLENRLNGVQQDLEAAQKDFSQFASKNTTIDIQAQGKAMIEAGATLAGRLAAAQTELEGLRQIYADGNVRVREARAQVDELERQLQKLGGHAGEDRGSVSQPGTLYPPIRELPLLGVTYADLYRRVKIQEAVFETLTQQYELAKVQEAKDTPSVKVLDQADLPERKSFPPRIAIILLGTILAVVAASVVVIGRSNWQAVDPRHPGKVFVREVLTTARTRWQWGSRNGSAG